MEREIYETKNFVIELCEEVFTEDTKKMVQAYFDDLVSNNILADCDKLMYFDIRNKGFLWHERIYETTARFFFLNSILKGEDDKKGLEVIDNILSLEAHICNALPDLEFIKGLDELIKSSCERVRNVRDNSLEGDKNE